MTTTNDKVVELVKHYETYNKLIDSGLIIAITPFADYLTAVGFESNNIDKEKLYRLAFLSKELK